LRPQSHPAVVAVMRAMRKCDLEGHGCQGAAGDPSPSPSRRRDVATRGVAQKGPISKPTV
jgi:hypothetical protein